MSQDPIGFGGGDANLYAYTLNNPITLRDLLGLCAGGPTPTPLPTPDPQPNPTPTPDLNPTPTPTPAAPPPPSPCAPALVEAGVGGFNTALMGGAFALAPEFAPELFEGLEPLDALHLLGGFGVAGVPPVILFEQGVIGTFQSCF